MEIPTTLQQKTGSFLPNFPAEKIAYKIKNAYQRQSSYNPSNWSSPQHARTFYHLIPFEIYSELRQI